MAARSLVDETGDSTQQTERLSAATSSAAGSAQKSVIKRRLCPHCSEVVSRATYFRHKRAFYDSQIEKWRSVAERGVWDSETRSSGDSEVEVGGADNADYTPPTDPSGKH